MYTSPRKRSDPRAKKLLLTRFAKQNTILTGRIQGQINTMNIA